MDSKKQTSLPGFNQKTAARAYGGDHTKGKRKEQRPFDPKQALHVVLRSSMASDTYSMLSPRHCNKISDLIDKLKKRWDVSVYRYANVGNHLHFLLRAKSRKNWRGFIRALSGGIAMIVTGAKKGKAFKQLKRNGTSGRAFWDQVVFTRIVRFGKDFDHVAGYVLTNLWEGLGVPVRKILPLFLF